MDIETLPFVLSTAGIIIGALLLKEKKKRKRSKWWVRPIFRNRRTQGDYHNLVNEMRLNDQEMFFRYTRMTPEQFDYLLTLVGPQLRKHSQREAIEPGQRLAVTLRFLATGDSFGSLSFSFRISKTLICRIVKETCTILWKTLCPLYIALPTAQEWQCISEMFFRKWNLPNCCGSLDGKHVVIPCPPNSGSLYFNYKHTYSIVLFAVCDANYNFTYVDIGAFGSQSDGGILRASAFGQALCNNNLDIPNDAPLPSEEIPFPYFFAGDEAFPLLKNLMRPFGGRSLDIPTRIFNYRLSRGRFCIENAFGILVSRWRIFHRRINALPDNVDGIIKATVCLHNYLKKWDDNVPDNRRKYCNSVFIDQDDGYTMRPGEWRKEMPQNGALQPIRALGRRVGARNATNSALFYRDHLKTYVNSPAGSVPWQRQRALETHKNK